MRSIKFDREMAFIVREQDAVVVIIVSLIIATVDGLIDGFSMRTGTLLIGATWGTALYIRLARKEKKF